MKQEIKQLYNKDKELAKKIAKVLGYKIKEKTKVSAKDPSPAFFKQTARDYDMDISMVKSIFNKSKGNFTDFYNRLESYLKERSENYKLKARVLTGPLTIENFAKSVAKNYQVSQKLQGKSIYDEEVEKGAYKLKRELKKWLDKNLSNFFKKNATADYKEELLEQLNEVILKLITAGLSIKSIKKNKDYNLTQDDLKNMKNAEGHSGKAQKLVSSVWKKYSGI